MPIKNPAAMPAKNLNCSREHRLPGRARVVSQQQRYGDTCEKNSNHAIQSFRSKPSCPCCPKPSANRLPARRLRMIGHCSPTSQSGTVAARNGNAVATTTRLRALLRMTASRAAKRNAPIKSGKRNSAPPRPIRPPRAPTALPTKNAATDRRVVGRPPAVATGWILSTMRKLHKGSRRRKAHCSVN